MAIKVPIHTRIGPKWQSRAIRRVNHDAKKGGISGKA